MRRLVLAVVLAVLSSLATVGIVAADHAHDLVTPGTTVVDIGSGQTAKCSTDPGGHQFHWHVHVGVPGTFAFAQGGQVSVMKTESATC
jgi:hypothetical protein